MLEMQSEAGSAMNPPTGENNSLCKTAHKSEIYRAQLTPSQRLAIARRVQMFADINAMAATTPTAAFGPVVHPKGGTVEPEPAEPEPEAVFIPRRRPSVEQVIAATAKHFNMSPEQLIANRRNRGLADARHIAMYVSHTETLRSYPDIGRRMGDRDHTTIIHGVRKIQALILEGNAVIAAHVDAITNAVCIRNVCPSCGRPA